MNQIEGTTRLTTPGLTKSESSGGSSAKNNKERMKDIKMLSLKRNSVMEHLFSFATEKN